MPYARKDSITWLPGQYYHIFNRGAKKATLFHHEDNYLYVLRKAREYSEKYHLAIIAYCLMPNHYHFLIRQDADFSAGMLIQHIFNGYTKAYNHRYGTSGTLFERRFQAKQIQSGRYMLHLCRYIHANPVKDGIVAEPEDWPYSNYREWIAQRDGRLVDRAFIREFFKSADEYQTFVQDYIEMRNLPEDLANDLANLYR